MNLQQKPLVVGLDDIFYTSEWLLQSCTPEENWDSYRKRLLRVYVLKEAVLCRDSQEEKWLYMAKNWCQICLPNFWAHRLFPYHSVPRCCIHGLVNKGKCKVDKAHAKKFVWVFGTVSLTCGYVIRLFRGIAIWVTHRCRVQLLLLFYQGNKVQLYLLSQYFFYLKPICFAYGIFVLHFHKNHRNVSKYTMHGSYGICHALILQFAQIILQ